MPTLREAREARGMSQQRLADEVGVRQATVSLWEAGRARIAPSGLLALGRILSVELDADQPLRRSAGREVECGTYSGSVWHVRNREEGMRGLPPGAQRVPSLPPRPQAETGAAVVRHGRRLQASPRERRGCLRSLPGRSRRLRSGQETRGELMPITPLEVLADARALWRKALDAVVRHVNECGACDSRAACPAYAQASQAETAAFDALRAAKRAVLS